MQHFRNGAKGFPGQFCLDALDLAYGHGRVLRVPAVDLPAQAAHGCSHPVAGLELATGCGFHDSGSFNAEHPRQLDARRVTLPREKLGPVQAKRLNANQHLASLGFRHRDLLNLEYLGSTRLVHHDSFHGWHTLPFVSRPGDLSL